MASKRRTPMKTSRSTSSVHHSPTTSSERAIEQLKWPTLDRFTPGSLRRGVHRRFVGGSRARPAAAMMGSPGAVARALATSAAGTLTSRPMSPNAGPMAT